MRKQLLQGAMTLDENSAIQSARVTFVERRPLDETVVGESKVVAKLPGQRERSGPTDALDVNDTAAVQLIVGRRWA